VSKDVFKKCFLPALECGVAINKKNTINALPAQIDLPVMEAGILDYWTKNQVFEKSVENRNGAQRWSFYEGPPTANGKPGTHHIEARVFKDLFPRFQTMKGNQKSWLGLPWPAG
jgi:isoleucyl-tRNA synthetase